MPPSVNQQIADALTNRQLHAGRVESGLRREVWAILAVLEADILAALKLADPMAISLLARRRRAVETLVGEEVEPLVTSRYARLAALLTAALLRLARNEASAVQDIINEATGEETIADLPSATTLRRAVEDTLIPTPSSATDLSAPGEEWWQRQSAGLVQRVHDQLLVSVSLEETLTQAVGRVRGTSDNAFRDGLMERGRQDAARLVRTQVTNAVSEARGAVADANAGPLMVIHQSILDNRTSLVCIGRNGLKYTVPGYNPIGHHVPYFSGPPYHPA
jgi:hypothetical protein